MSNAGSQAYVFCQFGLVFESFGVEYFGGELSGDDRSDTWVCDEYFGLCCQRRFVKCFFDGLFGILELYGDEEELFNQRIQAITQMF